MYKRSFVIVAGVSASILVIAISVAVAIALSVPWNQRLPEYKDLSLSEVANFYSPPSGPELWNTLPGLASFGSTWGRDVTHAVGGTSNSLGERTNDGMLAVRRWRFGWPLRLLYADERVLVRRVDGGSTNEEHISGAINFGNSKIPYYIVVPNAAILVFSGGLIGLIIAVIAERIRRKSVAASSS